MNFHECFHELEQKYPARNPGSQELTRVIEQCKETAANHGIALEFKEIPVYSLRSAVLFFNIVSCAVLLLSLVIPGAGLAGQLILGALLCREIVKPCFSRIQAGHSADLTLKIPARSKETQQVYLTAPLCTDQFADNAAGFSGPWLFAGIVVLPLLFQAFYYFGGWQAGLYWEFLVLAVGSLLVLRKRKATPAVSLANSAVLLELAAILTKSRASTTTVTILLAGARSLNSGIRHLYPEFKKNELAYLINLMDLPGEVIDIAAGEGPLVPLRSDPVLLELLAETARQKSIAVTTKSLPEAGETYPFKLMGRKAVTVTNPLQENSHKDLRELLTGLIRRIDNPRE